MSGFARGRLVDYGVAVAATAVTLGVRLLIDPPEDNAGPLYLAFCPAVMLAAYLGGFRPGLLATALSAAAVNYFYLDPVYSFRIDHTRDVVAFGFFLLVGAFVSSLCEAFHRSRGRLAADRRRYAVTLASIGDAVIATDTRDRVTFLNPAAEALTGWPAAEAAGRPLGEVFRVVNEYTRAPAENPAEKVLRTGAVAGLANHTALLSRDGREVPIDDSAAPIVDESGAVTGVVLVFRDVSGRRRADEAEAARRANEWLELAVRGSDVGVWDVDMPDGDYRRGRRHYLNVWEQFGYDRPPSEAAVVEVHPDEAARVAEAIRAHLSGETEQYEAEARFRCRDGSYRTMLARGRAVRDAAGRPVRFAGTVLDVTPLKRAEGAARASEERFRVFVEHAADAFLLHDERGRVVDANRRACESLGYARDELIGMTPFDFDADITPAEVADLGRKLDAGETIAFESRHRRKDGTTFPVEVRGRAFWEGGRRFFVSLVRDATERMRAEAALRESEERFRGTFENAAVGIAHVDLDRRYLRVNERYCAIVGRPRDELLAKTVPDITHPDDLEVSVPPLKALLRGEAPDFALEKRYVRKDGTAVWVEVFVSLQRDAAGAPAYSIAVIQDIADRRRLDDELRRAKDAAEVANRAKDEFLANVSHELRTPLGAVLGMTELALDTDLTDDQRQYLAVVKSSAENLLGILNDLLDFAKIEAGKLELDPADFSLRAVVGGTLRAMAARAHKKGLELIHRVAADVPDALVGDAGRLRQILLNLVGNAIKFTDAGEVEVTVRAAEERGSRAEDPAAGSVAFTPVPSVVLVFEVRDTGIGIPRDQQDRIFRAFEQEDTSTTRRYGGTGLGLTISARLVTLMCGRVTVESEPGRGSTFAFTARFDRQPLPPEQAQARTPVLVRDLPVLVVDDNATNRHILAGWLRGWQMRPEAVGDAAAALDALRRAAAAGRPYPLVLLDARMPGMDGLTLAGRLRADPDLPAARIILLTSGDHPADAARARELRIDAHLLKPIQPDELLVAIHRVMSLSLGAGGKPQAVRGEAARPSPPAGLRVLVAEDDEFNAQLAEQLLRRRGHEVRLARNGREALTLAEAGAFDVLLLDVHMPELDGFQVIRALRERERTAGGHLPVVALTARSRAEDREKCLAAGMDEFLSKPIRADELFATIDRVAGVRPTGAESPGSAPSPSPPPGPDLLDPRAVLAACGGDDAILRRICEAFRLGLPGQLETVRAALRDADADRLRDAAHRLCGMIGAFSTAAGGVASDLEDAAAAGRLDAAAVLADRLDAMAGELVRLADGLTVDALRQRADPDGA